MIKFKHRGLIKSLRWASVDCRYLVINPDPGGLKVVLYSTTGGSILTTKGEITEDAHRLSLSLNGIRELLYEGDVRPPLVGLEARVDTVESGLTFRLKGLGVLHVFADKAWATWD